MSPAKALFFDVFGTLMDWRTSIAREAKAILEPLGHSLDWLKFADAWRGEYQPGMEEVRSGKIPFSRLDVLHRRNLQRVLPRFGIDGLSEEMRDRLNMAWHRLDAWPGVPAGSWRGRGRWLVATACKCENRTVCVVSSHSSPCRCTDRPRR